MQVPILSLLLELESMLLELLVEKVDADDLDCEDKLKELDDSDELDELDEFELSDELESLELLKELFELDELELELEASQSNVA